MRIRIDADDRRPLYRQVADEIKALIARGELREHAALPSVRQVAADLGVNMNTIATAYRELEAEGLITVKHGSGAVVASRQSNATSLDDTRRTLRTVLTQLVLAGMKRNEIEAVLSSELRALLKGVR